MAMNRQQLALLVYYPGDRLDDRQAGAASRLFEMLTTNGYLGPSDIQMLAPKGMRYCDLPPTAGNLLNAISNFCRRTDESSDCILYLDSVFFGKSMVLEEGDLDMERISGFIEGMPCSSVRIFLRGPGSDLAAPYLFGGQRLIVYTSRLDGYPKIDDPLDISNLFSGDRILSDSVNRERARLRKQGFNLHWIVHGSEGRRSDP